MLRKFLINYDEIHANLKTFTYNEARRIKGPVYKAMVDELFEEGCPIAAEQFRCLAAKESTFFELRTIRDRLSDNKELLQKIFENVKLSEKLSTLKNCGGLSTTYILLHEVLELLEPHTQFDWLLRDVFQAICDIAERVIEKNKTANEVIARIFFKYGLFLNKKNELYLAQNYLEKAMCLARTELWSADVSETEWNTLHQIVGQELAQILLTYSGHVGVYNAKAAISFIEKAILVIGEVGLETNANLYYNANLMMAKYIVEDNNYELALTILNKIDAGIVEAEDARTMEMICKSSLLRGICLTNRNQPEEASRRLRKSLAISIKYNMRSIQADILLQMGKLHSLNTAEGALASKSFHEARAIYEELGDVNSKLKSLYLLAKLKADDIFPYFMEMLKETKDHYCSFYKLRQWKNQCKPFWTSLGFDYHKMKQDHIYCLLEEGQPAPVYKDSYFDRI